MAQYTLYRMEDDGTTTEVSQHPDLLTGIAAGEFAIEVEDFDFSYALYADGVREAAFAEGRIGYRTWATRAGRLSPALEDRFDHDIDELMV